MDAADLRMFQSVASTGSMSKAALELNTVQSNVTARIKSLEDEVGFALFERTNRGVTLTAAGRRLLPFAARAARLLDDARRAVADEGTPSGVLTIGSLDTTAALHLSPVLAAYVAAHPAVDLSLKTGTTCELVEQVKLGLAGKQRHVLVLPVHLYQEGRQRLHRRQGHGLIVHQHAALSARLDFPPQDQLLLLGQAAFLQPG